MKHLGILFVATLLFTALNLPAYGQAPLTDNMPAVGVLGQTGFVTGASGLTASALNTPKGIAVDPTTGKLFVADYENRRVLRWSSADKMVNGAAAEAVLGQPDFLTNTTGTSSIKMARPYGITVDAAGRLWVSDLSNNRVLRFDNASTIASGSAANRVLGQADFATGTVNTGGISASTMSAPIGVYVDAAGRLWVAERDNKRILRFDNAATKSSGDPADGVLGEPNFTTNTGGRSASLVTRAYGITGDASGRVWVSDRDNNRVLRFDSAATKANGAAANGVIGQLNFDSSLVALTQSGLSGPRGVSLDASGRLYVTDEGNNRILMYNGAASKANGANADHVLGQIDFISSTTLNPPTAKGVNYPEFLVVDNTMNQIWLADEFNNRILRFDLAPLLAVGVLGQTGFVSLTSGLTATTLNTPKGIAVDPTTGKLFVADYENRRVLRWSSADKMVNGAAAEAVLGQPDFTTNSSGTSSIKMARPYGITVDAGGRLWVADLSNNRVLRFDNASTIVSGSAANRVLGQADFATGTVNTGGISASTMSAPIGVYVDAAGRLWVAERDNKRILRFDNAAGKSSGDPADGVLGEPNFTTIAGGLTASLVTRAYGITGDASGRVWVSDRDNNRVLRFDSAATKANGAAANGVIGQADFVSNVDARTQSGLSGPRGVFINASGRLYVTDEGNNRILVFDSVATSGNGPKAVDVLGQMDFISAANPASPTAGSVNYPEFLVVDNVNRHIWLADEYNNRILRYIEGGAPALIANFSVAPKTIAFGSVVVIATKRDSVTVTNSGTAALAIDSVKSDNGMFTVLPASATIPVSGSLKFYVTFKPASAALTTGNVVFFHSAASRKDTVKVGGTGVNGPLFTEDFTSPAGTLLTAAAWTISGTSTVNPLAVTSPGLSIGKYSGSGVGNAATLLTTGQDVYQNFPTIDQGSVYFSMMLSVESAGTGDYFTALSSASAQTNYYARLHLKASGAGYIVGISKSNEVSGGAQYGTTVLNFRTTCLVVVKYTFAGAWIDSTNDPISVYVFTSTIPTTEPATPEISAYVAPSKTDAVNLGCITLRQGSTGAAPLLTVDGFRVGPSWPTGVPTGVNEQQADIPQTFELLNNFPNPFNPTTTIKFELPEASEVSLKIYDVLGREVATLIDKGLAAGYYNFNWNASGLSSGMYIYRINAISSSGNKTQNFIQAKKMILQK
jgi:streptogramin lyase